MELEMQQGLYYLAVPYNGSEEQKAYRSMLSLMAAAEFLRQGIHVFAPVIYVNQIAEILDLPSKEQRRDIVMSHLFEYLKVSKGMIVITADGWKESWGVRQELLFCQEHQIPVCTISPDQIYENLDQLLSESLVSSKVEELLEAA